QRPPGITSHERAIGRNGLAVRQVGSLDHILDHPQSQDEPAVLLKSARMTESDAPVTDLDFVRVAKLRKRILAFLGYSHQPRVESAKHAERFTINLATIVKRKLAFLVRLARDMGRRQHIAV